MVKTALVPITPSYLILYDSVNIYDRPLILPAAMKLFLDSVSTEEFIFMCVLEALGVILSTNCTKREMFQIKCQRKIGSSLFMLTALNVGVNLILPT